MRRYLVVALVAVACLCAAYVLWSRWQSPTASEAPGPAPQAAETAPFDTANAVAPSRRIEPAIPVQRARLDGGGSLNVVTVSGDAVRLPDTRLRIWAAPARSREPAELIDDGRTNADGLYRATDLPYGALHIFATRDTAGAIATAVLRRDRRQAAYEYLVLRPLEPLSGVVLGDGEAPVAGARVTPVLREDRKVDPAIGGLLAVDTDDMGLFAFEGLPQGKWRFRVEAAGYAPLVSGRLDSGQDGIVFQLHRGGTLRGLCLIDHTEEPAAGLAIRAAGPFMQAPVEATVAGDGTVDFGTVPAGVYELAPVDRVWVPVSGHEGVRVSDESETAIALRVAKGGTARGRVYVRGTDEGVTGVTVKAFPGGDTQTNAEGFYELTGLWPRETEFVVDLPPGYELPRDARALTPDKLEVAPGAVVENLDYAVSREGPAFTGQVVDAQGAPVPGAEVRGHGKFGVMGVCVAGADGRFELVDFDVGDTAHFDARTADMASLPTEPHVLGRDGTDGIVIRMDIALDCGITGMVVDRTGQPANCKVIIRKSDTEVWTHDDGGSTDSAGRFERLGLAPGTYTVSLFPEYRDSNMMPVPQTSAPIEAATVDLAPGQIHRDLRLIFDLDSGLRITGTLVDHAGNPVGRGSVTYSRVGGNLSSFTHTAPDGAFHLVNLEEGVYRIGAGTLDRTASAEPVEVEAGASGVILTLQPGAAIEGRVVDSETGQPVPEFMAVLSNMAETGITEAFNARQGRWFANPEGRFAFETASSNWIGVRAEGYRQAVEAVGKITPGGVYDDVVIRLIPEQEPLTGVVQFGSGEPIGGVEIHVGARVARPTRSSHLIETGAGGSQQFFGGGTGEVAAFTGADGTFRIEPWALPSADAFTVMAYLPGHAPVMRHVSGGGDHLVFTLEEGGHLTGVVTLDGQPAGQFGIQATYPDGTTEETYVRDDGTFWMNELPAGQVRVVARDESSGISREQLAIVEAGYETYLEFVIVTEPPAGTAQ